MILPTESINAANGDKSRQGESPTPFHRTVSARDEKRGGTELKGGKKRKVRIFQPGKEGFVIVGNWEIVESIVFLSLSPSLRFRGKQFMPRSFETTCSFSKNRYRILNSLTSCSTIWPITEQLNSENVPDAIRYSKQ